MTSNATTMLGSVLSITLASIYPAMAAPTAAAVCPPQAFADAVNRAANPSFEVFGPFGGTSSCPFPCTIEKESAASGWFMHTDNAHNAISTSLVNPSTVPFGTDPSAGQRMLRVVARGAEGGVFQRLQAPRTGKLMVSTWVYVVRGRVAMVVNSTNLGPAAWSSKTGQWEQLRVCNSAGVPIERISIATPQPSNGGEFFIDRVEARQVPAASP